MIFRITLILATLFSLLACNEQPTDSTPPGEPAFRNGYVTISADPDEPVTDRPITITTSCVPLIPGTGRFILTLYGEYPDDTIYVVSPVRDTLYSHINVDKDPAALTAIFPFTTNGVDELRVNWVVQLRQYSRRRSYHMYGSVHLDSVFIADSNRMFHYLDPVIETYYSRGILNSGASRELTLPAQ